MPAKKKSVTEKEAVALLKRYSDEPQRFKRVLAHARKVARVAARIAKKANAKKSAQIDIKFIRTASILHDIGRFNVKPGKNSGAHGYEGAKILRKEGLDDRYARVCETHVGCWLTKDAVKRCRIPIPAKDYRPRSIEEKIISYADKLVQYDKEWPFKRALERYRQELGEPTVSRLKRLHEEMLKLTHQKKR